MAMSHPVYNRLIKSVCRDAPVRELLSIWGAHWKERYSVTLHGLKRILLSAGNTSPIYTNEFGMVTAVALMLVAVLALLGTTAVVVTSTDILIGGNYKVSEQAFYAAEAGVEEARARLRSTVGGVLNPNLIDDPYKNQSNSDAVQWKAYIGPLGVPSLQTNMNYVVEIKHKVDAGNVMFTSTGANIYLVTSTGSVGKANRTVQVEVTRASPLTVPGPLYVKSDTQIKGASTDIIGLDPTTGKNKCGGPPAAAITTPNDASSIDTQSGNVVGSPNIAANVTPSLDIDAMVNSLKQQANPSYTVDSDTHTGMNWGTPTLGAELEDPSTCDDHNIVYYNTNGTYIKLAGGTTGCGILLVDGDLEVSGGFSWYGVIIVTGSLKYAGGGNKQVTGGMLSGGTVDADVEIGGNANIVYCDSAVNSQTVNLPLRILSWRDENQK